MWPCHKWLSTTVKENTLSSETEGKTALEELNEVVRTMFVSLLVFFYF